MIPKKPAPDLIRGGNRFPAFAKPAASAGEARSEKIMLREKTRLSGKVKHRFLLKLAFEALTH
jgi:hypothetical protein